MADTGPRWWRQNPAQPANFLKDDFIAASEGRLPCCDVRKKCNGFFMRTNHLIQKDASTALHTRATGSFQKSEVFADRKYFHQFQAILDAKKQAHQLHQLLQALPLKNRDSKVKEIEWIQEHIQLPISDKNNIERYSVSLTDFWFISVPMMTLDTPGFGPIFFKQCFLYLDSTDGHFLYLC